jgi:hypothetical protein
VQLKRKRRKQRRRARARRRSRNALRALTTSALALPGVASAEGQTGQIAFEYGFSYYSEDDLDSSKVSAGGEKSRYEIFSSDFHVRYPIAERLDLGVDFTYETMSGATPWYVIPDEDGDPVQVMTGATIEDQRFDALASGRYYLDNGAVNVATGVSVENDYVAFNGSLGGEWSLADQNTTLLGGAGFSIDRIEPTDAASDPFRPREEDKASFSVFAGISQVIRRDIAVQSTLSYKNSQGYLSDPYKRALVLGTPQADDRPDVRHQISWLNRYRHHFSAIDGSLHADYRFYIDDWSITSHTLELAWHQSLWHTLRLIPSFRYYTQSQADFYGPFFNVARSDGHYSSDYRLSPYGALSWRLTAETRFEFFDVNWIADVSWERYTSSGDYALGSVKVANPGLVSFNLISFSVTASF